MVEWTGPLVRLNLFSVSVWIRQDIYLSKRYLYYLPKIGLVFVGADLITLRWFNKILYKLQYYCIYVTLVFTVHLMFSNVIGVNIKPHLMNLNHI